MEEKIYHTPVLLEESIEALNIKADGIYVDVTFGGGGHSLAILSKLNDKGRLFAFDLDLDAQKNMPHDSRLIFINANFKHITKMLKLHNVSKINGLLADLGVSSHQIDTPTRGFSTRYDGLLDMRMNQKATLLAKDIINTYSQDELQRIFSEYSQIRNSKSLAQAIVNNRRNKAITTTQELKEVAIKLSKHHKNINKFLAQIFQAIRIELNQELEALKALLIQSVDIIDNNGRLVIISYHSQEDKMVKNFIKKACFEATLELKDEYGNNLVKYPFKPYNKKPIIASQGEIFRNSRARSAKLRVGIKID